MLSSNLNKIRQRISRICEKSGRDAADICLIAVTKGRSIEQISQVISLGVPDIGENRVQEALLKFERLQRTEDRRQIRWHMVGHLQSNKAADAVRIFDLIHSVDSLKLAKEIDKQAFKINKIQDILIEVKISPEDSKKGFIPGEVIKALEEISRLKNVNCKGLMTIAPLSEDPEISRHSFRSLRELRDKIYSILTTQYAQLSLSMGMSDDFEVAIEEGADMVRVGRAIFGN